MENCPECGWAVGLELNKKERRGEEGKGKRGRGERRGRKRGRGECRGGEGRG